MLAVADDLERALRSVPSGTEGAAWGEGVALVVRRIRDYLRRQGVEAVDPLGMPFDPELHEALLEVDAGPRGLPGTVTEVVMKGYRRGNRALRAARVVVAREPQQFRDPEAGHQEATDGEG
jgi:molecular chaperone GrpE